MKKLSAYQLPQLVIFLLSFVMLSICLFNLLTSTFDSPNVKMFMNGIAFSTIAIFFTINSLKK
jgi:hypothetical protein